MFCQIFLSLQVKQMMIISNEYGIYKFPRELPNNLRLRILGKSSQNFSLGPSLPPKMKILSILAKNCTKIEIELFP